MLTLDAASKHRFRTLVSDLGAQAVIEPADLEDALRQYIATHSYNETPISERLPTLVRLNDMARDDAWRLPRLDQIFIESTTRYLVRNKPTDVADVEWLVLQALAIDLLIEASGAELGLYEEFCGLRDEKDPSLPFAIRTRQDWLRYKREALRPEKKLGILGIRRSRWRFV